ncbi:MAG: hypothetical protein R3320_05985 [Nitriliruptorales bacterium]|nr:hypothetical protein [Nitriliruptorales bacterium]
MTAPDPEADQGRRRTRRAWRIAGVTALAGLVLALLLGVLGASGANALRVSLLVTALGTAVGGMYATVTLLVDDVKKRPVGRDRPIAAVALFVLTALLMAMVAGSGG